MRRLSRVTVTIAIVAILVVSTIGIGAAAAGTTATQSNDDADEWIVDVMWQTPDEDSSITVDTSTTTDTVVSVQSIIDDVLSNVFDTPDPWVDFSDEGDSSEPVDDETDADTEDDETDEVEEDDESTDADGDDEAGDSTDDETEDGTDEDTDDGAADDDDGALDRALVERYVHEAVNEERTDRGLEALAFDDELREIARAHSEDMAERGYFAHDDPEGNSFADRYEEHGYECRAYTDDGYYYTGGENIAYTYFDQPVRTSSGEIVEHTTERELANGIVDQWMNSDGHRENILAEYWNNEGIGIAVTDDNRVYATQNFC
ncbi:CAP domain-containing protein [Natrialbaceae archaeon A-gly3]